MTITEGIKKYRLPAKSTPEDLELRLDGKVLNFGDKVILAGYYFNGQGKPCYFGAVYEFLTEDHTCEGEIALYAVSEVEHTDDGHAIAWARHNA